MISFLELTFLIVLIVLIFVIIGILAFALYSMFISSIRGSTYVPNKPEIIISALELAELKPHEVLIDLGSGDGRVLRTAVQAFHCAKAVGYEIAPFPRLVSFLKTFRLPRVLARRISVRNTSVEEARLENADVIYLYLLPELINRISHDLREWKELNKNKRIVSVVFPIPGMKAKKIREVYHKTFGKKVPIYLY